jgi:hypothetical protein
MTVIEVFFLLIFCHYLADYPLQGDFLSQAKNRNTEVGKDIWKHALFAHGMIHAGLVAFVTGSVFLGVCELVCHMTIDYLKCQKKITFNTDQWLHLICKIGLVVIWLK